MNDINMNWNMTAWWITAKPGKALPNYHLRMSS